MFHGRGLLALRWRPALPPLVPTVPASDNHRAVPTRTRGREHTCPPPPSSPFMWLARCGKVQFEFSTDFTLGQRNFDMLWHLTEFRNHMTSLSSVELLGHISGTFYLNWQVPIANWLQPKIHSTFQNYLMKSYISKIGSDIINACFWHLSHSLIWHFQDWTQGL